MADASERRLVPPPTGDYPVWDIDPYDEAVLCDPYEFHAGVRERGPVVWLTQYGTWATGRHQHVHDIFSDWERFCSGRGVGLSDFAKETPWRPPSLVLEADPPAHTRTRGVLNKAMAPQALNALRSTLKAEADALVDQLVARKCFDAVRDLAEPYPLKVFPDAVGLAAEDRRNLLIYGSMVFNALGPDNAVRQRAMARAAEVVPWIAARCERDALAKGGFGETIYEAADAGEITQEEASLLVRSLLSAGIDTTVAALGIAVWCFASFPGEWRRVRENPKLARQAFEEVLRFGSPAHSFYRTSTTDVEIEGIPLGEGRKVLLVMAAANRDPRRWKNPDIFDVTRRPGGHVTFGAGIHGCVGQMMARLEAEALFEAMAARVDVFEFDGELEWEPNNALRMLRRLPVRIQAA